MKGESTSGNKRSDIKLTLGLRETQNEQRLLKKIPLTAIKSLCNTFDKANFYNDIRTKHKMLLEDGYLMACYTVKCRISLQMFQGSLLPPS